MILPAMALHSPTHISFRCGVDKTSATILAPYNGGDEYMARTIDFNYEKNKGAYMIIYVYAYQIYIFIHISIYIYIHARCIRSK
jgi:hypothetical protein